MKTLLFSLSLLLAAFPAFADEPRRSGDAPADPDKKVCKRMQVVGSRLPAMVCHTKDEWEQIDLATRNRMREIDSQRIQVKAESGG